MPSLTIEGLIKLLDEAIGLVEDRLEGKRKGGMDVSSEDDLNEILSDLRYRKDQATSGRLASVRGDVGLGLARTVLEHDLPDSALAKKISQIERYFQQNFVVRDN